MKVVVTLLVRNEEDIVGENVRFHLAHGADFIIATDNGSMDGTRDILVEYERTGVLELIDEPDDTYAQGIWVTRMAQLARTKYGADWVINADADEFWWPNEGDFKAVLEEVPSRYGSMDVEVRNFVLVEGGVPFWERMVYRQTVYEYHLKGCTVGKVCHRGDSHVVVHQGNHAVAMPTPTLRSDGSITILHYPVRSYEQFERKIADGGHAYENNRSLPDEIGHQWRRAYESYVRGDFREMVYQPLLQDVNAGIQTGELVVDTRLRDFLG